MAAAAFLRVRPAFALLWPALLLPVFAAEPLRITAGLQPYQVVQHEGGAAVITLSGHTGHAGELVASITSKGVPVGRWKAVALGPVSPGPWTAALNGVPVGGPYRVSLQVKSSSASVLAELSVDHVQVGDIWVLAGQSNMVGRARLDAPEPPDERVSVQLPDGTWAGAREPLHERKDGPDGVALGAGLGLSFAKDLVRRTGTPIGLIPCARGGTNLTQWDPANKHLGRSSLYGALLERVALAGGRVAGILWYQGESDARETRAALYAERFRNLAASLRADLKSPHLPLYYAQLSRFAGHEQDGHTVVSQEIVREAQRQAESQIPNAVMVATIDLTLEDHIHLDAASQRRMGRRFAAVVCRTRFPGLAACPAAQAGPRLAAMEWESPYRLRLRFSGVNGSLQAAGRVLGFRIADEQGLERNLLYRVSLPPETPNDVLLEFNRMYLFPKTLSLWYGRGFDPACNLTDQSDLPVPAFGPVPLPGRPRGEADKIGAASPVRPEGSLT